MYTIKKIQICNTGIENSRVFGFCILLFLLVAITGCKKDNSSSDAWEGLSHPTNFPETKHNMNSNPVTKAGFELGRKLFYETALSKNNTISCGSCHNQYAAFVHAGHKVSHGIYDKLGTRNAPPLQNLLWQSNFFWDGGVHNLELIALNPISNPVEMDDDVPNIITKLKATQTYPTLFKEAFGTEEITSTKFLYALAQFQAMLISSNSKYDKYIRGEDNTSLTTQELSGLHLVREKCGSCHKGELFSDYDFRNNGLDDVFTDKGRYNVSTFQDDMGKFKTPSLRNIEKTAPYMHDGRFNTLEQVLEHYNSGVKNSTTLDPLLKQNNTLGIPLTSNEKADIISFLKTLTDYEFITNSSFSEQ